MSAKSDLLKEIKKVLVAEDQAKIEFLPVGMVGSEDPVNVEDWLIKLLLVLAEDEDTNSEKASYHTVRLPKPSNDPIVSVITSLYNGREFLEFFLQNITEQTLHKDDYEVIIINVQPSQGETELIESYQQRFDNIRLITVEERIGIYEAWNLAIEQSKGILITNANVDDVRRQDCLEIQARHLLENPEVSVAYSDVFYTFLPNLAFDLSAKCDLKTQLPTVNKFNILKYNSPHNAPMWRRSLHDRMGYFDTSYRSASDHDFWIRSALEGAKFLKIDDTLISYFFNPQGMSTRKDSPGAKEGKYITSFYRSIYSAKFFQEADTGNASVFIPAEFFSTRLKAYETNFTITNTHIIYGPYFKLPMGIFKVEFHFSTEGLGTQPVVSSISFDVAQSQKMLCAEKLGNAERDRIASGKVELTFANFDSDAEVEFRIYTAGKPFRGKLKFHGVRLHRSESQ